jgi:hypothetical protein
MTIVTITTWNSSAWFQGIQHLEWGTMRLHAMNLLVGSRKSPYITNIQAIYMRIKRNETMFQRVIGSYHSRTCPLRTQSPGCSGGTRRHCYQSWCVCVCVSKVIACRLRWYLQVSGNSRYGNTLAGLKHHAAKAPLKTWCLAKARILLLSLTK